MSPENFNWLSLDDPEGSAKWIKEQDIKTLWEEFVRGQLFIFQCKCNLPEAGPDLGRARRLMRSIRAELISRGVWDV